MNLYKMRLKTDFEFFMNEMITIPGTKNKYIITSKHLEAIRNIQDNPFSYLEAYRGFGKSEIVSFGYILWRAIMWKESSIIFSANESLAYKKIDNIRMALEFENEKLSKYCSKGIEGYIWNRGELWIIDRENPITDFNGKTMYPIQSKIYGWSIKSSPRGIHVHNIIGDDIVVEENSQNMDMIEDTKNKWNAAVVPVRLKNSKIAIVGTPQTDTDLLSEIKKNYKWKTLKIPVLNEAGEPSCPDLHDIVWINEQKELQGERMFMQEYMLITAIEHQATIPFELLFKTRNCTISFQQSYTRLEGEFVLIGTDCSIIDNVKKAERNDSDYFTMTAIKLNLVTKKRTVLNLYKERGIKLEDQIDMMINWARMYNANGISIETHGAFDYVRQLLQTKAPDVPLYDSSNRSGKFDKFIGIPSMLYLFEKEEPLYCFPYRDQYSKSLVDALFKELNQLGKSKHDDLADAMLRCETIFEQMSRGIYYDRNFSLYQKHQRPGPQSHPQRLSVVNQPALAYSP